MRIAFLLIIFINCFDFKSHAQFLDLARVEYTLVPGENSNFEYSRRRILFNVPFRIKDDVYFFVGMDYSDIHLKFKENFDSFDKDETDDFTLLDLNLTYTFQMNQDWRFAIQVSPGISSNLETSLQTDDLIFSGTVAFIKDKKVVPDGRKPFRIIIGAAYSGSSGIPFPIPFISFYKKFRPKWSYNIGAPISNLQYHASENFRMKLYATMDGFNANLQGNQVLNSNEVASRIRVNMILIGSRFEYNISKHIESFITITRSLNPVVQLRENRTRITSLTTPDVMHYRIGVRCKI